MKLHTETRKQHLVDCLYSLGLCVSYDRVMTISTDVANSVCAKFGRDRVVVPPGLTKNTFTVGMGDHVDYNPSSTAAQHMPGTDCGPETPLTDSTTQGKPCVLPLPSTYTLVPKVEVKKHLTVPTVTVPCKLDVCHETA